MSELLFIRHAETDMIGTFCGHSDPLLNEHGRAQVSDLARRLRAEPIQAVYTSDLLRSAQTGTALAALLAVDCYSRPTLREIHFGQWEGLTWKDIQRSHGQYAQRWMNEYPNLPAPDGECVIDFERRVLGEVETLVRKANNRTIAVVTHAGVLRTVLCRLQGHSEEDAWALTQSYCSVVRYKPFVRLQLQSIKRKS
jgi:alpha-ribazole phosphatase